MRTFVPYSVVMRTRGFVHDPSIRNPFVSAWVPAGQTKADMNRASFNRRVDRTVDVLARFVAKWVQQSREMRRVARIYEAGAAWTRSAMTPNWGNLVYEEEERVLDMSDESFNREILNRIDFHRRNQMDVVPLIEWIRDTRTKRLVRRPATVTVYVGSMYIGEFAPARQEIPSRATIESQRRAAAVLNINY